MTTFVKPLVALGVRPPAPRAAGGTPAFEAVYEECFAMVWRALRRLGVSEDGVSDATQDVFLRVHTHLAGFEGRAQVRTWVYGISVNVAREHRRRRRAQSRVEPLDEEPAAPCPGPDDTAACREALRLLDELLEALDDDRRAVLVLAEWEEMTAPEIAAALGVNVNTVYTRLRAARADFEAALARRARRSR